jgi:hypothetical protein
VPRSANPPGCRVRPYFGGGGLPVDIFSPGKPNGPSTGGPAYGLESLVF